MSDAAPAHGSAPADWERRFRASRVGLPDWADDAPDRAVVIATAGGVVEVHSWDRATGALVQATGRAEGTSHATIDPAGEWIWWFDDGNGDEYGSWRRQPFGSGPDTAAEPANGGLPAAYPAGLALGRGGLTLVGRADDDYGSQIHVLTGQDAPRLLYAHEEDAGIAGLSEDGTLVAIGHSEHGDSRHPALRVVRVGDGSTVADLFDGPDRGVEAQAFAPILGDTRLLVQHERRGRGELLIWDVATGETLELTLDLPGEIAAAEWFHDGGALLVGVDHDARTRVYRVPVGPAGAGSPEPIGPADGTIGSATTRPDGDVWLSWSSAASPSVVLTASGEVLLRPPGDPAPGSVPVEDVRVEGPGGVVHALLRRPRGADGEPLPGPLPLVVDVHGGPTPHDTDT